MKRDKLEAFAREYLEALREDGRSTPWLTQRATEANRATTESASVSPRPGQIWTTMSPSGEGSIPILVYIVSAESGQETGKTLGAYLVHHGIELAADDDVIVESFAAPGDEALVVSRWRYVQLRTNLLGAYVGELSALVVDVIDGLENPGVRARCIGHDHLDVGGEGAAVLCWEFEDPETGDYLRYLTGPRILSDGDPRVAVREEYFALTSWLEGEAVEPLYPQEEAYLHEILERLADALRDDHVFIVEEEENRQYAFPPLEFGPRPAMRGLVEGPSAGAREFAMHCGRATALVYVACAEHGILVHVHARDEEGGDLAGVRIAWLESDTGTDEDETGLLWEGFTDNEGFAESIGLRPSAGARQRIEIEWEGVVAAVAF